MKASILQTPRIEPKNTWKDMRVSVTVRPPDVARYARKPWMSRLPAVFAASLMLVIALLAAGVTIESAPLLLLLPLLCLPLCVALALYR